MIFGMKWLLKILAPIFLFSSPQEEIFQIFDIPTAAPQNEIVERVQQLWLQQGKERWQFETRYEHLRNVLWPLFEKMGMVNEIKPSKKHYGTVLVFGALYNRVQDRINYLVESGVSFDKLVLLTGERPLLESEKQKMKRENGDDLQTEAEMMRWVYEASSLSKEASLLLINVPMKEGKRPNTLDTILAWLETNPETESILAISNQPYVHYQQAVLESVVPFKIEVVGPTIQGNPSVDLMLDTFARELIYQYGDTQWLQRPNK